MVGLLLAINEFEIVALQELVQGIEGNLGGVCLKVEHRLAEKHLTDGNAVKPSHELTVVIGLKGMGDAQLMEMTIRFDHFIHNPGPVLVFAGRLGTM